MQFSRITYDFIGNINVDNLLLNNKTDKNSIAILSPHASYFFSGDVSALSFNSVIDKEFENVFILSTIHTAGYKGSSILNEDYNISNTERRRKLAKKLKKEIYGIIKDLNLNDEEEDIFDIIVKALKLNLNIYNHMGKLEKYYIYDINRNTFCLFFNNDHYCPISFISEEKHLFFNFKSDGL